MARAAAPAFPVLVLAAAGLMAAPAAALAEASTAAAPSALSVTVVRPLEDKITETLLVTGSLLPREEIEVGPEIEGYRVVEILAEVGDAVAKGQVLARLSREVLETQLAQNTASAAKARAAIAQQRATVDQTLAQETEASAAVDRARQLRKSGTVSQETLDERERAVKVASAQVAAAREALIAAEAEEVFVKAQRDEIEVRLKRTEVRAPAAGIVLARTARVGAIALSARAEPLFRIAQDGAIDLDAEVPEDAMPRMKAGLKAEVTPAGFDAPLAGTVRLVSAEVDKSTRLGKVKIALPADPRLKPGAYGRGVIELGSRSGLSLPQSAVMFDAAGAYVLGVANGIVARRPVKVALKSAGRILVVDGLVAGEQVVARAGGFLREGDRVSPIETAANEVR
jgi:RND family efflux transporter MFP subunit